MSIKEQLEREADAIVADCGSGDDINAVAAKRASARGYTDRQVQTLAMFVNRHHFKVAMADGRRDEIKIADASRILHQMHGSPKPAIKSASCQPGIPSAARLTSSGDTASIVLDYGPAVLEKLGARQQELRSAIRAGSARLREDTRSLLGHVDTIRRTGLDKTASYQEMIGKLGAAERDIVDLALGQSKTAKESLSVPQLKLLLPRALGDLDALSKIAGEMTEHMAELADLQSRQAQVGDHIAHYRKKD